MSTIISNIKVEDVPSQQAKAFKAVGVIGEPKLNEISNGYTQVVLPITYDKETGGESTFTARYNVRAEWFTQEFVDRVRSNNVTGTEKIQYDINMSGLTRGLFAAAGLASFDFDGLQGKVVGFKTKNRKDDPSRLDISFFYAPPKTQG
jgi:hypothetical protein